MDACAVLVTGIQAAGKSTVGRLLAERFERGAFVEGDLMRELVVSGREDMTPDPSEEAEGQLHQRYRNGALLVDSLVRAGFTAVHADIIMGADVDAYLTWVASRPVRVVVLEPSSATVAERERARGTRAYRGWTGDSGSLEDAIETFQGYLRTTPRHGLWLTTDGQSPEETVDEIIARWGEAVVLPGEQ